MTREEKKERLAKLAMDGVISIYDIIEQAFQFADTNPHRIPVEEELPPKMDKWTKASDYVLVYTNEGEWLIGRYWHDGDGWSVSGLLRLKSPTGCRCRQCRERRSDYGKDT